MSYIKRQVLAYKFVTYMNTNVLFINRSTQKYTKVSTKVLFTDAYMIPFKTNTLPTSAVFCTLYNLQYLLKCDTLIILHVQNYFSDRNIVTHFFFTFLASLHVFSNCPIFSIYQRVHTVSLVGLPSHKYQYQLYHQLYPGWQKYFSSLCLCLFLQMSERWNYFITTSPSQ